MALRRIHTTNVLRSKDSDKDEKVKHDNAETEFKHWIICE